MKHKLKLLLFAVSLFATCSLTGCGAPKLEGEEVKYNISTVSKGGKRLVGVEVKLYVGRYLMYSGVTGGNGAVSITAIGHEYTVKFDNLPKGYSTKENYKIDSNKKSYVFEIGSSVIDEQMPEGTTYMSGDVIYDFTLTDTDGNKFNFLKEYKKYNAYILNFFFVDCPPCLYEFPALQQAYDGYKDKIGIIGIDVRASDSNEYINAMKEDLGLTFTTASDVNGSLSIAFGADATPTTIVIDSNGVIAEKHVGSQTSVSFWVSLFMKYTM